MEWNTCESSFNKNDKLNENERIGSLNLYFHFFFFIQPKYRAISWKLMLGYIPTNKSRQASCIRRRRENYWKGIRQHYHVDSIKTIHDRTILDQVLKDVPRTAPQLGLFSNERILASMERILFLWAIRNPASSYVQGTSILFLIIFFVSLLSLSEQTLIFYSVHDQVSMI